jgi:sugar (pentulose or hexulose) kinase
MSLLYEKSATWRKVVAATKQSPLYMAAFTATCFIVPCLVGSVVMWGTNDTFEAEKEKVLRARQTVDHQVTSSLLLITS